MPAASLRLHASPKDISRSEETVASQNKSTFPPLQEHRMPIAASSKSIACNCHAATVNPGQSRRYHPGMCTMVEAMSWSSTSDWRSISYTATRAPGWCIELLSGVSAISSSIDFSPDNTILLSSSQSDHILEHSIGKASPGSMAVWFAMLMPRYEHMDSIESDFGVANFLFAVRDGFLSDEALEAAGMEDFARDFVGLGWRALSVGDFEEVRTVGAFLALPDLAALSPSTAWCASRATCRCWIS